MRPRLLWTACISIGILCGGLLAGRTAWSHDDPKDPAHGHAPAAPSIRISDRELHESPGGVPRGWAFALPAGNARAGREAFVKFECFKCHAVKGEAFPAVSKGPDDVGPELTGMGDHHPPLFFAQSLLDPNAVILDEKGFTGPDGRSKMPDFTESMSLREWMDVVAYIGSLKGGQAGHGHGAPAAGPHTMMGHGHHAGGPSASAPMAGHMHHGPTAGAHGSGHAMTPIGEAVAGDYKVSLVFMAKGAAPGGGGPRGGHVMAFVKDRETGADVPYLGVTVAFAGPGTPSASLPPMLGGHGFHYGSDMAFAPGTYQVKVRIGPAAGLQAPGGKYQKPVEVTFPWELK